MCDAISNAGDKNFAIIIDEALSSIGADSLNKAVQSDEAEGQETDDLILKLFTQPEDLLRTSEPASAGLDAGGVPLQI